MPRGSSATIVSPRGLRTVACEQEKSADWWPGVKAEARAPSTVMEVEPQEEPEDKQVPPGTFKFAARSLLHAIGPEVPRAAKFMVFEKCFSGIQSVQEELTSLPFCPLGMSGAELPFLPPSVSYHWWEFPFELRFLPQRKRVFRCAPFGVDFLRVSNRRNVFWLRPFRRRNNCGPRSRLGRPRRTLPQKKALQLRWRLRFLRRSLVSPIRPSRCLYVNTSMSCPCRRSGFFLTLRRLRSVGMRTRFSPRCDSGRLKCVPCPHGALPCMIFAPVAQASCGARNAWLRSLEWGCLVRVFRGFNPVSSHVKVPSGRPRLGRLPFVSKKAFDVARDKVGRSTR